jgi:hypothetical protein
MTSPRPETVEREKGKLFLPDAELIRRLGVPEKTFRPILCESRGQARLSAEVEAVRRPPLLAGSPVMA